MLLKPHLKLKKITDIEKRHLDMLGVDCLLLDIDNTVSTDHGTELVPGLEEWISAMKDADLILVIRDGKVAERGTHEELLAQKGYYWQTYCLQYGIPAESAEV